MGATGFLSNQIELARAIQTKMPTDKLNDRAQYRAADINRVNAMCIPISIVDAVKLLDRDHRGSGR